MSNDAAQPQPKKRSAGRRWRRRSGAPPRPPAAATERAQHLDLDTLSAYLDGQLAAADHAAAGGHLATCMECGRDLAELRATVALLRGLPQYLPRRSFRLGPEHARVSPRPGGWFANLMPALPALRAATVAVAVLLVAVTAGDLIANREAAPVRQPGPAAPVDDAAEGEPLEAVQAPAVSRDQDEPAAFAPTFAADPAALPGTEAAGRASNMLDEAADAEPPAALEEEAPAARQPAPAVAQGIASPGAVGDGALPAGDAAEPRLDAAPVAAARPSGWRLAQVALGLALLWLIVGLVGLERLRGR